MWRCSGHLSVSNTCSAPSSPPPTMTSVITENNDLLTTNSLEQTSSVTASDSTNVPNKAAGESKFPFICKILKPFYCKKVIILLKTSFSGVKLPCRFTVPLILSVKTETKRVNMNLNK